MSVISTAFDVLNGLILYARIGAFLFAMRCVFYYYDVLRLKKKCLTHLHEVVLIVTLGFLGWEIKEVFYDTYLAFPIVSRISFWGAAVPLTIFVWSKLPSMNEDFR